MNTINYCDPMSISEFRQAVNLLLSILQTNVLADQTLKNEKLLFSEWWEQLEFTDNY